MADTRSRPTDGQRATVERDARRLTGRPDSPDRRRFLSRLSLALSGLVGGLVSLPVVGYLFAPLFSPPRAQWVDLGDVNYYPVGQTRLTSFSDTAPLPWAGSTAQTSIYVRRTGASDFTVFAVYCTHLGCPVNWLATAEIFLCPCHGGVYYRDGTVAAGPPSRPLYNYDVRVDGGRLFVQTQPLPPGKPGRT